MDRAAAGEEIVIARNGKPIARLVAVASDRPARQPGGLEGKIQIADDFDEPLPPDLLAAFYNGPIEPPGDA